MNDPRLDPHNLMAKSGIFSTPNVIFGIQVTVGVATFFLLVQICRWYLQASAPNPFAEDDRLPRKPYVINQKERDAVLKQSFAIDKVPTHLDAIVIGSGIGGLTTASILAKSGKTVLVLEQHDQAGGCCHSYIEKGYEFDVGIHYIGDVGKQTFNKTLVDQICNGQLEWAPMDDAYDVVSIGFDPKENRRYPLASSQEKWARLLRKQFPSEHLAIYKFFKLINETKSSALTLGALKLAPLWVSWLVIKTGLIHLFSNLWRGHLKKTTYELIQELTDNKDLQTVFTYCWGDYGSPPKETHIMMQSMINRHYMNGAFYPVGGASEIAYNIIPVIERSGGKVMVRANVKEILHNGKKAMGVLVQKGKETYKIEAPVIISSAGVKNTIERLLPMEVAQKSYLSGVCKEIKNGIAAMNVFIGLNASVEELKLKKENIWAFSNNETCTEFGDYMKLNVEDVKSAEVPLLFISFPSAKDPNWSNHPGRANKATCALVTMANWEWYKQFENKTLRKRGDDYDEIKNSVGDMMVEQACQLVPQMRHHIDYVEIGSPVTNKHYIASPKGEVYGLDHGKERFDPWMVARLRPQTDIPGLYLSGQDVFCCGFTGALFGGMFAAGAVLNRHVMGDLTNLHIKLKKELKKKKTE